MISTELTMDEKMENEKRKLKLKKKVLLFTGMMIAETYQYKSVDKHLTYSLLDDIQSYYISNDSDQKAYDIFHSIFFSYILQWLNFETLTVCELMDELLRMNCRIYNDEIEFDK